MSFGQNLKTTFPKEFSKEFWLIKRQHEYNYIAEIKFGNFYSRVILGAKYFFFARPKVLIYAKRRDRLFFFASKEAYPIVRQLEKILVKKTQAIVVKMREKQLLGP